MSARTKDSRKPVGYGTVQLGTELHEAQNLREFDVTNTGAVVVGIEHYAEVVRVTLRRGPLVEQHTWRKTDRIVIIDR